MEIGKWLRRAKHPAEAAVIRAPRAAPQLADPLNCAEPECEWALYDALRTAVPVIDAALTKIVRLTGGFRLTAENPAGQKLLDAFAERVPVGCGGISLQAFADQMLGSLLTYGNAFGEILPDPETGAPAALCTAHPRLVCVQSDDIRARFLRRTEDGLRVLPHPERILFAALDPPPGSVLGMSVLHGLPALSKLLLRIFQCIGKNYERAGNVRYAVTYRPDANAAGFAREHAETIAAEWTKGIHAAECGEVQDFIAVGDVDIKVIGAENPLLDTNVPVRQILEQIVSKLSIPPFLLGFSWATTERMSKQQADILTSELEYFRRVLSPVLRKIGTAVLHGAGINENAGIAWENINLQDETELAAARLANAQAAEIELRIGGEIPAERN